METTVKNSPPVFIENLITDFEPAFYNAFDFEQPTNLPSQEYGFHAYICQQHARHHPESLLKLLSREDNLIKEPLQMITCNMVDIKVTHHFGEINIAEMQLIGIEASVAESKQKGEEPHWSDEKLNEFREAAKTPTKYPVYELFFRAEHYGVGHAVILRNSFLLMCLQQAGINSFSDIKDYRAVMIYNPRNPNAEFVSFVKFEKK